MISIMNEYLSKIHLYVDDLTKSILQTSLNSIELVENINVLTKSNRYIVDIKLEKFEIEEAVRIMNIFMEQTRFHYSAYFIRFNEGNLLRYRYATCKENKDGYYCDVMIH